MLFRSVFCQAQGGDQGTRAFIQNLYSAQMLNPEMTEWTLNSEAGIKAMQYVVDEVNAGHLTEGITYAGTPAIEAFVAGTVSGTLLWTPANAKNHAATLEENGIEVIAMPYPSDDETPDLEYYVGGPGSGKSFPGPGGGAVGRSPRGPDGDGRLSDAGLRGDAGVQGALAPVQVIFCSDFFEALSARTRSPWR